MGRGWPTACLVVAVLTSATCNGAEQEPERWSRQATSERRQGDWVPLTCAHCRPVDQGPQASDSLPSVLTPPPRAEEARLLPPPPPDSLFQQAATGFLQAYTHQRKPHQQFLQETTAQSVNHPQSAFLKAPPPGNNFVQEPSTNFQPPQQPQPFNNQQRQPHVLQYNHQSIPNSPYLNQPLLIGPQFLAAPFFPQPSIPQNIQPISPIAIQPLNPIAPNVIPDTKQNFQLGTPDKSEFIQQITAGIPEATVPPQNSQTTSPQLQYTLNETESQREEAEKEVQLLYVPVETLNQRGRNVGRQKSVPNGQQNLNFQQNIQDESNKFTNLPLKDVNDFKIRNPHFEDQTNFNTDAHSSRHQFEQNVQFQQQQQFPDDQEQYNSQTHAVRQQFLKQQGQFQQQPSFESTHQFKVDSNTKQQYNFKQNNQFQQPQKIRGNFEAQADSPQNPQILQTRPEVQNFQSQSNNKFNTFPTQQGQEQFGVSDDTINQQFDAQTNFRPAEVNVKQQFDSQVNFQQPSTQPQQEQFNPQGQFFQQDDVSNINSQFQQAPEVNQQFSSNAHKEQHYIDQPIQLNQQQGQALNHQVTLQQQVQQPGQYQETQTRVPDVQTTQKNTRQRFRHPQQTNQNLQQSQNSQFQQHRVNSDNLSPVDQAQHLLQNQQQHWTNQGSSGEFAGNAQIKNQQEVSTQQNFDYQQTQQFVPNSQQVSNSPPTYSSTTLSPQTTPIPNQPPLSVYMETTDDNKVNDVLRLLKNAKTIQVLDTVGPDSPQVFVGPSNLRAPNGYIKFELPYLNALENNRVERKVDKLPFFVAPLNFNPPPGYSKIPFPAPHIGSVVVSNITVLKNALHEKPYEHVPLNVQPSTERYFDEFTLPAEIPAISPQLPSLVNSLQDEHYDGSTTALTSTTEPTTTVYTTPTYRGRGSTRGSHRGTSIHGTSTSPTRKPQSRTRRPYDGRPYSRRQPVTTPTTTTLEPSTEATVQHFTPQPEQVTFNADFQQPFRTSSPSGIQASINNQGRDSVNTFSQDTFAANNFNQGLVQTIAEQQTAQQFVNENIQQTGGIDLQNQYQQNPQVVQNSNIPLEAHTTSASAINSPEIQEDFTVKNQRPNGLRRDPSRQQQRFRSRQRLTTTTEVYQEQTPAEQHFDGEVHSGLTYQNIPRRNQLRNQNPNRLVENVHFRATEADNNFNNQQTERADIGVQTTERLLVQNNEQLNNQNNQYIQQSNFQTSPQTHQDLPQIQNEQYHQPQIQFPVDQSNFNRTDYVDTTAHAQEFQQNTQNQQFKINQFQQIESQNELPQTQQKHQSNFNHAQSELPQQPQQKHQTNFNNANQQLINPTGEHFNTFQQNIFDQSSQQRQQESIPNEQQTNYQQTFDQTNPFQSQNQQFYVEQQTQEQSVSQPTQQPLIVQDFQSQQSVPSQLGNPDSVAIPQESLLQTQLNESPQPQIEDGQQVQHNQHRLVKYNRQQGKQNFATDTTKERTHSPRRGQSHFQINTESSASTVDETTTKASFVRVRGRVRNKLRGSTKTYQSTTTEAPNYPTTFLNKQKTANQEREESQDYVPRKRVNYSTRQSITYSRNSNEDSTTDQSVPEIISSTERRSTEGRFADYADVAATTTTEEPTTKVARRYQHILNRNKVRRVRPTNAPSTSGSSGTTKFLLPTSPPPVTRLPGTTRGRIRKPQFKSTTTEFPQVNPSWNEKDNFAPSAGSNEILEPLYQTKSKAESSYGFQRAQALPIKTTPKPIAASATDEAYWNQPVQIQQSTSFDFKPDASSVTPASFPEDGKFQGSFSPIWDGQIELQDGNYYDVYNQKQIVKGDNDQTPFSSDTQKVVYKDIKNRFPLGKENQYPEKTLEVAKPIQSGEEETQQEERMYPVYREVERHAVNDQEETSSLINTDYEHEQKNTEGELHEKDIALFEQQTKDNQNEDKVFKEEESESKEGPLKRKIYATAPGKKVSRRRGNWVRVRVRKPQDVFETAESQNLPSLSENAIQGVSKLVGEKGGWSGEPSTEQPQTTEAVQPLESSSSEPGETITFEDALKDMLKEFITNSEEDNETEVTTTSDFIEVNNRTEPKNEENTENLNKEGEITESDEVYLKSEEVVKEDVSKKDFETVKTTLPDDVTSGVFTQDPTTIFQTQTAENVETTLDPEITTVSREEKQESEHSTRVLGTSTTTEISLETEICYRGRCVKTKKADKQDSDSDLLPME